MAEADDLAPLAGPRQTGTTAALLSALAAPPPPPGSGSAHGTSSSIRRIGGLNDELQGGLSASLQACVHHAWDGRVSGCTMHHEPAGLHARMLGQAQQLRVRLWSCSCSSLARSTCSMLGFGRKGMEGTTPASCMTFAWGMCGIT